jgi:hypothetical protein
MSKGWTEPALGKSLAWLACRLNCGSIPPVPIETVKEKDLFCFLAMEGKDLDNVNLLEMLAK